MVWFGQWRGGTGPEITGGGKFSYFFIAIHGSVADRAVSPTASTSNTCNHTGLLLDRSVNLIDSQYHVCDDLSFSKLLRGKGKVLKMKWQGMAHNSLVTR